MEQIPAGQQILPAAGYSGLNPCWMQAPAEGSPAYFRAFSEVSATVQGALRELVPATYFADIAAFGNTKTAYPMLVYQASLPFRAKLRTDLTYDVLNPHMLAIFYRSLKLTLPDLLDGIEAKLCAAGASGLAIKYARKRAPDIAQSVQRLNKSRKCLYILIRSEALLVNALGELGGLGDATPKERARRLAGFQKKWSFQLRRLYPGTDFTWLAPELLSRATEALRRAQNSDSALPNVFPSAAAPFKPASGEDSTG